MAIKKLLLFFSFLFLACSSLMAQSWKTIDDGLDYAVMDNVYAIRIDPKKFRLAVVSAKDFGENLETVDVMAKNAKALVTINGGFFSPEQIPLGLIVKNGKKLNPAHENAWWAVFQMQKNSASIFPHRFFKLLPDIEMAIQAGPRLLIDGVIPKLKHSLARRSGIGIGKDGKIILAMSENEISLEDFAAIFKKPQSQEGLGCANALNLDGGASSQLYINANGFYKYLPGVSFIPNGVAVFKR